MLWINTSGKSLVAFSISIAAGLKVSLHRCPKLQEKACMKSLNFSAYPSKTVSLNLVFNWPRCSHQQSLGVFQSVFRIFVRYRAGHDQSSNFFTQLFCVCAYFAG